ncbi:hypothetical protein TNIN_361981 [Trichonephila inaurata madagascariensis]|uniref:Uncharacterized protein n=1 Tax=Trichonephila inaurata madagascariensis TaxID=2747483 RepID=A0A8X6XHQ2_9ARAC|nr:hypothetical protein TNIN_361981 [Trichonephila inaurata madagascariensis]
MDEWLDIFSTYLLVFIKGADEDINLLQELASLSSMCSTITEEDAFNKLKNNLLIRTQDKTDLICLTVDGGKKTSGIKKVSVRQVETDV